MIEIMLIFVCGFLVGYIVRLLVEDSDKKYEMMKGYQDIISNMVKELEDDGDGV